MRKGQYTLVEQVVLFALGLAITLGFLYTFQDLRSGVAKDVKERQSDVLSDYLAATAVEMVASGAEGKLTVDMPGEIGSASFVARFGEGGVKIQTKAEKHSSSIHGLSSRLDLGGRYVSGEGPASVSLEGTRLRIGRAEG